MYASDKAIRKSEGDILYVLMKLQAGLDFLKQAHIKLQIGLVEPWGVKAKNSYPPFFLLSR